VWSSTSRSTLWENRVRRGKPVHYRRGRVLFPRTCPGKDCTRKGGVQITPRKSQYFLPQLEEKRTFLGEELNRLQVLGQLTLGRAGKPLRKTCRTRPESGPGGGESPSLSRGILFTTSCKEKSRGRGRALTINAVPGEVRTILSGGKEVLLIWHGTKRVVGMKEGRRRKGHLKRVYLLLIVRRKEGWREGSCRFGDLNYEESLIPV